MDSMGLWEQEYGPRWAGMKAREDALREQAFVSWNADVLGEPLRQLTLGDMLRLQGAGNPFIAGGAYPEPCDVLQFMWELHAENRGGLFRRWRAQRRMVRRVALRKVEGDAMRAWSGAINAYLDDVFLDAPRRKGREDERPLGVCFMASFLVRIASALGATDPATGAAWADVPVARIFQYLKAITRNELGKEFKDFSPSDKIMSDWLAESNRVASAPAL